MAGPLAHFATKVRSPDLILSIAEWVAVPPPWGVGQRAERHPPGGIIGTEDQHCGRRDRSGGHRYLVLTSGGVNQSLWNLDQPGARAVRFLRYYRQVLGRGTMAPELIEVA